MTIFTKENIRVDSAGAGNYGASRNGGRRKHNGVDFVAVPGTPIPSTVHGVVTKLGYTYADDLSYRYVEIETVTGSRHRFFYVKPLAHILVGYNIEKGNTIGKAQNVSERYPGRGMINHVHYEIILEDGDYINPMRYLFPILPPTLEPLEDRMATSKPGDIIPVTNEEMQQLRDPTLATREKSHGKYKENAALAQLLKESMKMSKGWDRLSASQRESLHLIATKIARIISGDPNHADSWHDIAGYAKLIEEELEST